ncbi:hypothetical protein LPB86_16015 [Pedobacter sp. MC2016-14]|uniref:hypothetical protein n=1 Tax=Pedobacter sp. MC2016-14 TaxID=2897327 RepID=UPI001E3A14C0|nr:hypothetical protein [Pedobacter sp. MC2016-14]MCD0489749.1 hypothetical protein [Pedobacter sp. MC2016-14]
MDKPGKRELIPEISELLKGYEEAYEPGAWEAFAQPKSPAFFRWGKWVNIAAVFLLVMWLIPLEVKDLFTTHTIYNKGSLSSVDLKNTTDEHKVLKSQALKRKLKPARAIPLQRFLQDTINTSIAILPDVMDTLPYHTTKPIVKNKAIAGTDRYNTDTAAKERFIDFLKRESEQHDVVKSAKNTKKESNWDFGVELLPTMTNSNLNMGAGLSTAFKLSKSFSLSSGIAFMQLDASRRFDQGSTVSSLSPTRQLTSSATNISAIDIPIALTYNVNSHFYTSVGVSYFTVLNEKRDNSYLSSMPVSRSSLDANTGQSFTSTAYLVGENIEPASNTLNGNSYVGFLNFSVGRKQQVFSRYNFVLEPFIKVPLGKLSQEELRLTNGGMKIRFSF